MSDNLLVSVIIPCYRQAHFLRQAVESALAQTYPAIEIIVVDDGSPDRVEEALAAFATGPNLKLIRQPNQGVAAARNTGLRACQGQLIQFLDADDWLHPQKISRQAALLAAQPDLGLVYCDYYQAHQAGEAYELSEAYSVAFHLLHADPDHFKALWLGNIFPPHAPLVRRAWIEQTGYFNPEISITEDYDFWLRLSLAGCPMQHLPERLAYYRLHQANKSKQSELHDECQQRTRARLARLYPDRVAGVTQAIFKDLGRLLEAKNEWLNHLEQDNRTLQAATGSLREQLRQVRSYNQELDLTRTEQHAFIQQLETSIKALQADMAGNARRQAAQAALESQLAGLVAAYNRLEADNRAKESYIEHLHSQLAVKNEHIRRLEEQAAPKRPGPTGRLSQLLKNFKV